MHGPNTRLACASNLGYIGRACLTYAEAHDGSLPTSLDLLTVGGRRALALPNQLVCPACGRAYDCVPGHTTANDPAGVLAYEPLSNHGGDGANVLRVDGSVKWMKKPDYQKLMAQLKNPAPTATRPAPATTPQP